MKGSFLQRHGVSCGEKRKPLTRKQEWQRGLQDGQGEAIDPTVMHSDLREARYKELRKTLNGGQELDRMN